MSKADPNAPKRLALIASKGTLDWAYPPFILATAAGAMGWEVGIFFTFFGLPLLKPVLTTQVNGAYQGLSAADAQRTVVAYEPVWAIGTGVTASDDEAQQAHAFVRGLLAKLYGDGVAQSISIQYGGSMKPENAAGLLAQKDIDGGLIGGAALKADSFLGIVTPGESLRK